MTQHDVKQVLCEAIIIITKYLANNFTLNTHKIKKLFTSIFFTLSATKISAFQVIMMTT